MNMIELLKIYAQDKAKYEDLIRRKNAGDHKVEAHHINDARFDKDKSACDVADQIIKEVTVQLRGGEL